MAEITKELGRIPVSRGNYQSTTEYYKDNIVQYKRGSYQVVSESPIIGVPPTNDKNIVNPGWTLFAGTLDAQDVVNQIKEQETKSIQAVVDREAEILAKSDSAEVSFDNTGTSLSGTNVQDALVETDGKVTELCQEVLSGVFNYYDYNAKNDSYRITDAGKIQGADNSCVYRFNSIPSYWKKIKVLADVGTDSYAISFFTSNSTDDFKSGVLGSGRGMKFYEAEIPEGTIMICVTHTTLSIPYASFAFDDGGYVPIELANSEFKKILDNKESINELAKSVADGIYNHYAYNQKNQGYGIRPSDGQIAPRDECNVYRFNNIPTFLKKIRVLADADSNSYALGFYTSNSDTSFTTGVLGTSRGRKIYEADIPAGTVMICVSHLTFETTDAIIMFDDGGYIPSINAVSKSSIKSEFGNDINNMINQKAITTYLLDSIISEVSNKPIDVALFKYNIVRGIFSATGKFQSDSVRIVTKDLIDVRAFSYFSLVLKDSSYEYNIAYYSEPNEDSFICLESSSWISGSGKYRPKGAYMRIQAYTSSISPTPMNGFDNLEIKGYNRIITEDEYQDKMADAKYDGDVFINKYTFVQGALIDGALVSTNSSYISSEDFINVGGLRSIKVVHNNGYKSAVVLYNDDKSFLISTPAITTQSYSVDVSGVNYIKLTIGKTDGSTIHDGETHITIIGVKDADNNAINAENLYKQSSIVNGVLQNASSRLATPSMIDIRNLNTVSLSVANNYYYAVVFYTSKEDSSFVLSTGWTNIRTSYDVSKFNYMRVTIRKADNSDILPTDGNKVSINSGNGRYDNREYKGESISLRNKMQYTTLFDKFVNFHSSEYNFDYVTQQGFAIHNGYAFFLRHHAIFDIVDLKSLTFVSEYEVTDIAADKPHCNTGSFSRIFPEGNNSFPYLYTDRCSYRSDAPTASDTDINCCYVLNVNMSGATLAQTITFANDNGDYTASNVGGAWGWFVDSDRNRLICIGYAGMSAGRKYIIKEFALPLIDKSNKVVSLHDADVIEQWDIPDNYNGIMHAWQGATIYGRYIFIPISRGDSGIESEAIRVFDKYNHKEIASFDLIEPEVGEAQCVAVWNGKLYIASKNGRLDAIDFDC